MEWTPQVPQRPPPGPAVNLASPMHGSVLGPFPIKDQHVVSSLSLIGTWRSVEEWLSGSDEDQSRLRTFRQPIWLPILAYRQTHVTKLEVDRPAAPFNWPYQREDCAGNVSLQFLKISGTFHIPFLVTRHREK